ncbi:Werner syndrome-like exonuclease, partial [Tanacetum coccineum]
MEKNKTEQQSDWDFDFTEEELQSIEAAFESASSSSSRKPVSDIENGRKTRRRLPDSLFNSSALLPCPRNRVHRSNYRDMNKVRIPAMAFKGHIVYSRTLSEVEKAADELLTSVETMTKEGGRAAIGFDIEWKPSFRK